MAGWIRCCVDCPEAGYMNQRRGAVRRRTIIAKLRAETIFSTTPRGFRLATDGLLVAPWISEAQNTGERGIVAWSRSRRGSAESKHGFLRVESGRSTNFETIADDVHSDEVASPSGRLRGRGESASGAKNASLPEFPPGRAENSVMAAFLMGFTSWMLSSEQRPMGGVAPPPLCVLVHRRDHRARCARLLDQTWIMMVLPAVAGEGDFGCWYSY
ncbi:hypothetical protein LY76DRAFT_239590 [Colletotrichum caudatum]|nr:hypothetical protein LY76DRAFT_239590 [Colletotrichum caudatum]